MPLTSNELATLISALKDRIDKCAVRASLKNFDAKHWKAERRRTQETLDAIMAMTEFEGDLSRPKPHTTE